MLYIIIDCHICWISKLDAKYVVSVTYYKIFRAYWQYIEYGPTYRKVFALIHSYGVGLLKIKSPAIINFSLKKSQPNGNMLPEGRRSTNKLPIGPTNMAES